MKSPVLAVVIPTRNRAEMAIRAIDHLREEAGQQLIIFVSDNSSREEEVRRVADHCAKLADPLIIYMRAPDNLHQGAHWDWAIRQAFERSEATHATVHYDRKIVRPGHGSAWLEALRRFPDKVITYSTDFISIDPPPRRLWQPGWTGKLYRLDTDHVIAMSARGEAAAIGNVLPILSNCLVPRSVVEAIVDRFGTLCDSTTADSCFAYRFCALHPDYLHLDRSITILYGSERSAGLGYLKGEGGDFADYRSTWRGETWMDAAIIPGLNLGYNMLFHEYELVRRALGDDRLPPLDRAGCLRDLGRWLAWIEDPGSREELRRLLIEHGWDGGESPAEKLPPAPLWRRAARRLRRHVGRLLRRRLPSVLPETGVVAFDNDEEGLRYALDNPSPPTGSVAHIALANPEEIGRSAA